MRQTSLWEHDDNLKVDEDKLREKIIKNFFNQGFIMDYGNLIAENYEEFLRIENIKSEVKK